MAQSQNQSQTELVSEALGLDDISGFYGPGTTISFYIIMLAFYIDLAAWGYTVFKITQQSHEYVYEKMRERFDGMMHSLTSGAWPEKPFKARRDRSEETALLQSSTEVEENEDRAEIEAQTESEGRPISSDSEYFEPESIRLEEMEIQIAENQHQEPLTPGIECSDPEIKELDSWVGQLVEEEDIRSHSCRPHALLSQKIIEKKAGPICPTFGINTNFLACISYHIIVLADVWKRLPTRTDLAQFGSLYTAMGIYEVTYMVVCWALLSLSIAMAAAIFTGVLAGLDIRPITRHYIILSLLLTCLYILRFVHGCLNTNATKENTPIIIPEEFNLNLNFSSPALQTLIKGIQDIQKPRDIIELHNWGGVRPSSPFFENQDWNHRSREGLFVFPALCVTCVLGGASFCICLLDHMMNALTTLLSSKRPSLRELPELLLLSAHLPNTILSFGIGIGAVCILRPSVSATIDLFRGGFRYIPEAPGDISDLDQATAIVIACLNTVYSFYQLIKLVLRGNIRPQYNDTNITEDSAVV